MSHFCFRCQRRPCRCTLDSIEPDYRSIESERQAFEAYMRRAFPAAPLERYGHSYRAANVHNRWLGWCAAVRAHQMQLSLDHDPQVRQSVRALGG